MSAGSKLFFSNIEYLQLISALTEKGGDSAEFFQTNVRLLGDRMVIGNRHASGLWTAKRHRNTRGKISTGCANRDSGHAGREPGRAGLAGRSDFARLHSEGPAGRPALIGENRIPRCVYGDDHLRRSHLL